MHDRDSNNFHDPGLQQALVREASRMDVDPALERSIASILAEPPSMPLARPRPWPIRTLSLAAATLVVGVLAGFLLLRETPHHDEYTIAEERLWPALAGQYQTARFQTDASTPATRSTLLNDARYRLLGTRNDLIETVPCTVADYRRDDGATFSVILARAADLVSDPEEEAGERYDETSGSIRIVGGIKGDYWVCVAAPASAPADLFLTVLDEVILPTP